MERCIVQEVVAHHTHVLMRGMMLL